MPVAVVENGTRPNQRVVTGTVATIADNVAAAGMLGPALIIIGTVITLRDKLAWFNEPAAGDAVAAAALGAEVAARP